MAIKARGSRVPEGQAHVVLAQRQRMPGMLCREREAKVHARLTRNLLLWGRQRGYSLDEKPTKEQKVTGTCRACDAEQICDAVPEVCLISSRLAPASFCRPSRSQGRYRGFTGTIMTPEEFVEAIGTGNVVHNSGTVVTLCTKSL